MCLVTGPWFRAVAEAEPETWRLNLRVSGYGYCFTLDAARSLHAELGAAIDVATAQVARESALPLAARVWLYLARLSSMTRWRIARDLVAPEDDVRVALAELVLAGRVEDLGDLTYKALGKHDFVWEAGAAATLLRQDAARRLRSDGRGHLAERLLEGAPAGGVAGDLAALIGTTRTASEDATLAALNKVAIWAVVDERDQAAARAAIEAGGGR